MNLPDKRRVDDRGLKKHWTLDDIPWARFDAARVDPNTLMVVKTAALVEANARSYATYLGGVFAGDDGFRRQADAWAEEEVQHGRALAKWAYLADPSFDFDTAFTAFREMVRIDEAARESVRGSRCGELVARCMVEVGTSSYYSALRDATDEPVLRAICEKIAADEVRHYKFFLRHLRRYQVAEGLGFWRRLNVALERIGETEDDELSYAYYAANIGHGAYDRHSCNRAYMSRAITFYRQRHFERGAAMIFNAVGLRPGGMLNRLLCRGLARLSYLVMCRRAQRWAAAGV